MKVKFTNMESHFQWNHALRVNVWMENTTALGKIARSLVARTSTHLKDDAARGVGSLFKVSTALPWRN